MENWNKFLLCYYSYELLLLIFLSVSNENSVQEVWREHKTLMKAFASLTFHIDSLSWLLSWLPESKTQLFKAECPGCSFPHDSDGGCSRGILSFLNCHVTSGVWHARAAQIIWFIMIYQSTNGVWLRNRPLWKSFESHYCVTHYACCKRVDLEGHAVVLFTVASPEPLRPTCGHSKCICFLGICSWRGV